MKDNRGMLQLPQENKHYTVQTCKSLGPKQLVTNTKTLNSIPDKTTKLIKLMLVTQAETLRLCLLSVFQLTTGSDLALRRKETKSKRVETKEESACV
jgi:hypothetical protein